MPEDQFFGLDYVPQVANETNDETFCELRRLVEFLLKNGALHVRRPNREFLLQIRRGEFEYQELVAEAEKLVERVEMAFAGSTLLGVPDKAAAEQLLRQARQQFYNPLPKQRHQPTCLTH